MVVDDDDDDDDEDDDDVDGGVVEGVFDYSELQGLCDAHLRGTFCEHYHLHHAVVLDDDVTTDIIDDYDCTGTGDNEEDQ